MDNKNLKKFTMKVRHTNPDASVTFTSIGVGETQKEAAVFSLGMFFKFMDGEFNEDENCTDNYNEALGIVNEHLENPNDIDEIINELILEKNSQSFYESTENEVKYEWSDDGNSHGGYIIDIKVEEYLEDN